MPDAGKAVTRVELYDAVYRTVGLSRSESAALVELVLNEISDSIARGETVSLAGVALPWARRALTAELASSEDARNSERAQVRANVPLAKSTYLY